MDNDVDQVIQGFVADDSKGNAPVAKEVDEPLDAALVDMAGILPDF